MRTSSLILILGALCGAVSSAPIVLPPGTSIKLGTSVPPANLVALGLAAINSGRTVVRRQPESESTDTFDNPHWKRAEANTDFVDRPWKREGASSDSFVNSGYKREGAGNNGERAALDEDFGSQP